MIPVFAFPGSNLNNIYWHIIDNTGCVLLQKSAWVKKGNNEILINVKKLATGSYYLKVSGTCFDSRNKFQKL